MMTACWSCGRDSEFGSATCDWCGVWLTELDPAQVPPSLAGLLPAARRWGISDDGYRWDAVERAGKAELETLSRTVESAPDDLWTWLVDESYEDVPSAEYVALTALTMAYDHARLRLEGHD